MCVGRLPVGHLRSYW